MKHDILHQIQGKRLEFKHNKSDEDYCLLDVPGRQDFPRFKIALKPYTKENLLGYTTTMEYYVYRTYDGTFKGEMYKIHGRFEFFHFAIEHILTTLPFSMGYPCFETKLISPDGNYRLVDEKTWTDPPRYKIMERVKPNGQYHREKWCDLVVYDVYRSDSGVFSKRKHTEVESIDDALKWISDLESVLKSDYESDGYYK